MQEEVSTGVEECLTRTFGEEVKIRSGNAVGGGCINQTSRIQTSHGSFFLKWNEDQAFPGMFEAEAGGLKLLSAPGVIRVPKVIGTGTTDRFAFLILEFIDSHSQKSGFWEQFGKQLAELHSQTNAFFGLDHDNYIGSLPQQNTPHNIWTDFFREERLEPQLRMARDAAKISSGHIRKFEDLFNRLDSIFPGEPPALLHGDLWSGNFMVDEKGMPCIIDPAVYYGHREMDLAMTRLFGGFSEPMYTSYQEVFPLEKGYRERFDICNLYPLMVHVNLFGGGYIGSVESILRKFR